MDLLKTVRTRGDLAVRIILASILLLAAALKAYQLSTEPTANKDIFSYRWTLIFQVEFEIVLGIWLISGLYKRASWAVALLCFTCFCGITLYKAFSGEPSCGCFGKVSVNPRYTMMLDAMAVVSLLLVHRTYFEPRPRRFGLRLAGTALLILALGGFAGAAMASYKPAIMADYASAEPASKTILLEPEQWVGKRFPLEGHIDVGPKISEGVWVVMLYRYGCPRCEKAVPIYKAMARQLEGRSDKPFSTAMIEIPPYGPASGREEGDPILYGHLSDQKKWFVTTPVVVLVFEGTVKAAWDGEAPDLHTLLEKLCPGCSFP